MRDTALTVSLTFAPISVVERTLKPCVLLRARSGVRKPCFEDLADGGFDGGGFGFKAAAVAQNQTPPVRIAPSGLASPLPAMSGAEPWTGS